MEIDVRAKELLTSVTEGLDFSVPSVDFDSSAFEIPESLAEALKKTPEQLTIGTLTECTIDGNGCFDKVMTALKAHLTSEYEAGRITGAEYTKAYIASIQGALQFSVQYLLGKDNAYFTSLGSQAQALRANIEAYTAKVQLAIAQAQANLNKAQYAGAVLQLAAVEKQKELVEAQTEVQKQQKGLLVEQTEQAHSQVSDTQLDGITPVSGYTGNQNKLLKQQVEAFKHDAIVKGSKIFTDSFATQLSMSAATAAGTGLDAAGIAKATAALQASIAKQSA